MNPKQKLQVKYRIGGFTLSLMLGTACVFWGIQVLLSFTGVGEIVSWGIGVFQDLLFFFWFLFATQDNFYLKGSATEKFLVTFGCSVVELLPFINDVPATVIQVVTLILISRKEDRDKAKAAAAHAEKAQQEEIAVIRARIQAQKIRNAQRQERYEMQQAARTPQNTVPEAA